MDRMLAYNRVMFCQSCGNQVNPDLRYCNSCGARLDSSAEPEGQIPTSTFNIVILASLFLPLLGIGLIIGLLVVMKKLDIHEELMAMIALTSFMLLALSEGGLLFFLLRRARGVKKADREKKDRRDAQIHEVVMKNLGEGQPVRAARDLGMPSVTEHTTRTLDMVPRDK